MGFEQLNQATQFCDDRNALAVGATFAGTVEPNRAHSRIQGAAHVALEVVAGMHRFFSSYASPEQGALENGAAWLLGAEIGAGHNEGKVVGDTKILQQFWQVLSPVGYNAHRHAVVRQSFENFLHFREELIVRRICKLRQKGLMGLFQPVLGHTALGQYALIKSPKPCKTVAEVAVDSLWQITEGMLHRSLHDIELKILQAMLLGNSEVSLGTALTMAEECASSVEENGFDVGTQHGNGAALIVTVEWRQMKCVRLSLVVGLVLLGSCSAIFGNRGTREGGAGVPSATSDSTAKHSPARKQDSPVPAAVENLSHLPVWLRPSNRDLESSRGLVDAVRFLGQGEAERAAVQLQQARSASKFGSEVIALHAWALLQINEVDAAEAVAREGITSYGATPALGYSMAVIFEAQERYAEALPLYHDLSTLSAAKDSSMLMACARTAVAARRGPEAMQYLDRWMLTVPLGIEGKKLRAEALQLSGRDDEALALYQQMLNDWPQDFSLLADMANAAYASSQSTKKWEHLELSADLLRRLTEIDPQRSAAFRKLGRTQDLLGRTDEARSSMQRCLELEPGDVLAGLELADLMGPNPEASAKVLLDLLRQPLSAKDVERVQSALLELR